MKPVSRTTRRHGAPPFTAAVLHGGPGAAGEMAPVAQELAARGMACWNCCKRKHPLPDRFPNCSSNWRQPVPARRF